MSDDTRKIPAEQKLMDGEELILALTKVLDKEQTRGGLFEQALSEFKERLDAFRAAGGKWVVEGAMLEDGTIEVLLGASRTPVRIAPDCDVAIGEGQIARQKARS